MLTKTEIRMQMLKLRGFNNHDSYVNQNKLILDNVISLLTSYPTNTVGIFYPVSGEPNLLELKNKVANILALPRINHPTIEFYEFKSVQNLVVGPFKQILEPLKTLTILPDLIFVPGLSFSLAGHRLGFGGGYYDRYLSGSRTIRIGVAFHQYLLESIPFENHDQNMDYILTDKIFIQCH